MSIVELDLILIFLLDSSNLLSDDKLSEVNIGMLNFKIFLISDFVSLLLLFLGEIGYSPSHVWILCHNFGNDFLVEIMEILESLFDVIVNFIG